MRFACLAAAITVALALSGCSGDGGSDDGAYRTASPVIAPSDPGTPWAPSTDLWVARLVPCATCEAGTEEAANTLLLLHRNGAVMRIAYGQGGQAQLEGYPRTEGDRSGLTFVDPAMETYRTAVADAWVKMHGAAPDKVRIHDVHSATLDPAEAQRVAENVHGALTRAEPLDDPSFACDSCSAPVYWTYGEPQDLDEQRFGVPGPQGAWADLEMQMQALERWVQQE